MKQAHVLALFFVANLITASVFGQAPDPGYTNTAARMTEYISNSMDAGNAVGLGIALADGDQTVWAQGFGYADREADIPVTTSTVFRVGSVSKVFTTTAALILMDQGKVDLDAPVTNYIPEFAFLPRFPEADVITVRMLLDHQSGLPGDIYSGMFTTAPLPGVLDWLVGYLQTDYPVYPPLFVSVYCNTGFVLAEGVISSASGKTFVNYARDHVFDPLGMNHSSFLADSSAISDYLAHPYVDGVRFPDEYVSGYGTGGMYASMPDLIRYLRMVNAGGVLEGTRFMSTNALAEMTFDTSVNCALDLLSTPMSGMGWDFVHFYELDYAGPAWIKSGGTLGYTAYIIALPDQGLAVATAANSRSDDLLNIAVKTLQYAVLEKTGLHWPTNTFVPPVSPITNLPRSELEAMAGLYVQVQSLNNLKAESSGKLTLTLGVDAETPVAYSNLTPRANGWFSDPESQLMEWSVTNKAGETILLKRVAQGPYQHTTIIGQYYEPVEISNAWLARTNKMFLVDDVHPLDYLRVTMDNSGMTFSVNHDVLWHESNLASGYLHPYDDDTAFLLGLQNRGASSVQSEQTNGVERLQAAGYHFIDAESTSFITPGESVSGKLEDTRRTDWFRVVVRSGVNYALLISSEDNCAAWVCDNNVDIIEDAAGLIRWSAPADGVNYIGIYGDGYTNGSYTITLAVANNAVFDYTGDGATDLVVYDPVSGVWYIRPAHGEAYAVEQWGFAGAIPVSGDYTGDGKTDLAVYDPVSGVWYVRPVHGEAYAVEQWGFAGVTPLPGDYTGDGATDLAVYDPVSGVWYIRPAHGEAYAVEQWGFSGAIPVPGDYTGDGKTDLAVYDSIAGVWYVRPVHGEAYAVEQWGFSGAIPVPGDYTGDGKTDLAVYDSVSGVWYIRPAHGEAYAVEQWGFSGAIPVPGDYTGDGKTDLAVYDPASGVWYVRPVHGEAFAVEQWGFPGAVLPRD